MQRVKKHMDLRYLESSPAKNTPEARQIEAMLAVRGVDRSAVPTAYNIAWNYHLIYANGKTPERIAKRVVQDKVDELNRTGKLGADFWEQLFQIKPTVFFGQKDFNSPAPGEPMLDK